MKKSLLLSLVVLLSMTTLNARPIDAARAKTIGQRFAHANFNSNLRSSDLQLVYTGSSSRGEACFYAFNVGEGGFVIVSADDRFRPIVGYSDEGPFETENPSPELMFYLDKIIEARTSRNVVLFDDTEQEWQSVATTGRLLSRNGGRAVDYICTTKWNQDSPYNLYAPEANSGPGGRCYAGCVATAMSQVMKRWNHPLQGTGSYSYYCPGYGTQSANFGETTYDWEHMPDRLAGASQQEIEAVALFMYHCGVSVEMQFSPSGSGANSWDVPDAIQRFFSYSSHADLKWREGYSLLNWQEMLKESHDIGWPVYYSGFSNSGGHAFVCDGYDDSDLFHFNWGWGGSSDGYFVIDEIDYAGWAQAVFNYVPSDVYEYMPLQPENLAVSPSGDFDYAATLTWTNPTQDIHMQDLTNIDQIVITRNGKIIHTEDNVAPGAVMNYTDHYLPRMVDYCVYAVVHNAMGLTATVKNVLLGPTCEWTVEMTSSSSQGWNGGALSFINSAGDEVAHLSLETAEETRTISLPLGHVEIQWLKPEQAIEDFRFKVKNGNGSLKAHFHGSSSDIQNGLFYIINNTCDDKDGETEGTHLTATISDDQVTLTWDPVENSLNYQVFRDGLLFAMTEENSFVDDDTRAIFHTYNVTAFTTSGEILPSNTCSYHPESPCIIPTNLHVEATTPGKAKLTWDAPEDESVAGYMLYRRPKGGEFKRIKLTSNTNYTDNLSGQPDGLYEYACAAYYQETHCESGYATAEGHPELNFVEFNKTIIPQHLDFFIHEGRVILEWEEGTLAEGYNVYRNGEHIAHGITGHSFVDYTSTIGETYYYTITGYTAHVESNPSNVVRVDWTTDVNENTVDQTISIYPNPTKNTVTIEADGLRQIRVFNIMGQTVICQTALEDNITIDLSAQPQGCYFIETTTVQGCTTTKIVKL
jgi:hypothetical protein